MNGPNPLRCVLVGAISCLTTFGVLAQDQSFFTGGAAVSLTEEQARSGKGSMTIVVAAVMAPSSTMDSSARLCAAPLSR
jgi:hypothetical protein